MMKLQPSQDRGKENGFSLIELLVVIGLISVIGAAILTVIVTTTGAERRQSDLAQEMDSARLALDRMRKELRGADHIDATSGPHQLTFERRDGTDVTYCVRPIGDTTCASGTSMELVRWEGSASGSARTLAHTLVPGPTDPFVYQDSLTSDSETPPIAMVTIGLSFDRRPGAGTEPLTVAAEVRVRNVE